MFDVVDPPNLVQEVIVMGPYKAIWLGEFDSGALLQWACRHPRDVEEWPAAVGVSFKACLPQEMKN